MHVVDLITAKRDGHALSAADWQALIQAYTADEVPDYQMSALLMACFWRGLDTAETFALTRAMLHSGEVIDLSDLPGIKVDKHSTGGVGDKISLILAPLVAACGVPVPMISGRGLGHSGGTLDKLEAIPGFRTDLSVSAYRKQLEKIGVVMIGQTRQIAPADRKLYALRDVTGTIECIPLIAASIMSKKLAEGLDALVIDAKCGRGAFMKTPERARTLAQTLVEIGTTFGKPTVAWRTNMDAPLGYGIGNWPETREAIACLRGEPRPDVMALTYTLAGEMLHLGGMAATPEAGQVKAKEALASGKAFETLVALVTAQGGDARVLHDPETRTTMPPIPILSPQSGHIQTVDALALGKVAVMLGAGRLQKSDQVDPLAGLTLNKKPGDHVGAGEPLAFLHTQRKQVVAQVRPSVIEAFDLGDERPAPEPLLFERITAPSPA